MRKSLWKSKHIWLCLKDLTGRWNTSFQEIQTSSLIILPVLACKSQVSKCISGHMKHWPRLKLNHTTFPWDDVTCQMTLLNGWILAILEHVPSYVFFWEHIQQYTTIWFWYKWWIFMSMFDYQRVCSLIVHCYPIKYSIIIQINHTKAMDLKLRKHQKTSIRFTRSTPISQAKSSESHALADAFCRALVERQDIET